MTALSLAWIYFHLPEYFLKIYFCHQVGNLTVGFQCLSSFSVAGENVSGWGCKRELLGDRYV